MKKSLYGYYIGYMCYWLNGGLIRHWVAPQIDSHLHLTLTILFQCKDGQVD
jgi:hypothetical protein